MARVIQVVNVDSAGHHVRLADGSYAVVPHPHVPHIGEEMPGPQSTPESADQPEQAAAPVDSTDEPVPTDPADHEVDGGA